MKNKLMDLNNHLFEQLERLNDSELSVEDLEKEIKRTDAMVKISTQIVENAQTNLRAASLLAEYGGDFSKLLPEVIVSSDSKPALKKIV